MSKCDIWSEFECKNRISNVKMRYPASVRMSKNDFECQNAIFSLNSNVKIRFRMSKGVIRPEFECQKKDFECQNEISGLSSNVKKMISNVEMRYLA